MNNYEAVKQMTCEQMANFLSDIYYTGINNGMYISRCENDFDNEKAENNPYNENWLSKEAEAALLDNRNNDDKYLPDFLTEAILRNAQIGKNVLSSGKNDAI